MAVVNIYNQKSEVVGELSLPEHIFEVKVQPEILHLVVKSQLSASRVGTVKVKTRSTIRGGGRKPWRQKGTGRARAGTIRSPLWKGGAVVHGPKQRSYEFKVNKKIKKLALKMALSNRLADKALVVVDKFLIERPKTKEFVHIKDELNLDKALIVVPEKDTNLSLASRNVPNTKVILDNQINVYDILNYSELILTPKVVENLQERLQ